MTEYDVDLVAQSKSAEFKLLHELMMSSDVAASYVNDKTYLLYFDKDSVTTQDLINICFDQIKQELFEIGVTLSDESEFINTHNGISFVAYLKRLFTLETFRKLADARSTKFIEELYDLFCMSEFDASSSLMLDRFYVLMRDSVAEFSNYLIANEDLVCYLEFDALFERQMYNISKYLYDERRYKPLSDTDTECVIEFVQYMAEQVKRINSVRPLIENSTLFNSDEKQELFEEFDKYNKDKLGAESIQPFALMYAHEVNEVVDTSNEEFQNYDSKHKRSNSHHLEYYIKHPVNKISLVLLCLHFALHSLENKQTEAYFDKQIIALFKELDTPNYDTEKVNLSLLFKIKNMLLSVFYAHTKVD